MFAMMPEMPEKTEIIWDPLPDITTFELACALKVLFNASGGSVTLRATYATLPAETRRHFRVISVAV